MANEQDIDPIHRLQDYQLTRDSEMRQTRPFAKYHYGYYVFTRPEIDPLIIGNDSNEDAISSKDSIKWLVAMQEEMNSFIQRCFHL